MSNKSGLDPKRFESVVDGKETKLYVLTNRQGAEMTVCNYGGTVVSLMMPDRNGVFENIVLGMEDIEGLVGGPEPTLGAAIGRYGNRIAKGKFCIDGKEYVVACNEGINHLHGGNKGYNKVVWDCEQKDEQTLVLRYTSPDGEEGYPGTLQIVMIYTLTDDNEFRLDYSAITDKKTICNLTNHSYFNLNGVKDGQETSLILNHELTMVADSIIDVDPTCIPLGGFMPVEGTPFDFRTPHTIGERVDTEGDVQIKNGAGYDHCYAVNADAPAYTGKMPVAGLRLASIAKSPETGRVMKTYTTEPGMQLYIGNFLKGFAGYHGATFPSRSGFCLESQHHPDSINQPAFEQPILLPGQVYAQTTIYAFSAE